MFNTINKKGIKMKKELLEAIDETIITICNWIEQLLSDANCNGQSIYPNGSIKALAELISARALLKEANYSFSDSSKE